MNKKFTKEMTEIMRGKRLPSLDINDVVTKEFEDRMLETVRHTFIAFHGGSCPKTLSSLLSLSLEMAVFALITSKDIGFGGIKDIGFGGIQDLVKLFLDGVIEEFEDRAIPLDFEVKQ